VSIYFDKRRETYAARTTINGVRKWVGSFETKEQAERAIARYWARHLNPAPPTDSIDFRLDLELMPEPDWLAPFRRLKAKLLRKKLEAEMDKHLEKVR
jgi:hypothetical protein